MQRRDIEFPTLDGLTLRGWLFPGTKGGPAIILHNGVSYFVDHNLSGRLPLGVLSLIRAYTVQLPKRARSKPRCTLVSTTWSDSARL